MAELLAELGLEPARLMPARRPATEVVLLGVGGGGEAAPFPPFLPLHLFDDERFEVWTPREWMAKGVDGQSCRPLPGRALLPNVASNLFGEFVFLGALLAFECVYRLVCYYID